MLQKCATFTVNSLSEIVDPQLLMFIQRLTQSVRSRKRQLFQNDSEISQIRRMRQLYLLCTIMFCTNSQCSMPLHTLLTEATLCHGGSQELVRILNRLGATASLETSKRLAATVVHERMARGIKPDLVENALSIVSTDNIDILQLHAFVSTTDGTRSWHGTSVQCVQPLPVSAPLHDIEMVPARFQPTSRKHPASSPTASPLPILKLKCRHRTLTEKPSPHTSILIPETGTEQPGVPITDIVELADYLVEAPIGISVSTFNPNPVEKQSLASFQEDIFQCMMLKHAQSSTEQCPLPGLPSLINCISKQSANSEVSNVIYVEILSEKADSKATLMKVVGKLHKTFIVELGQKWLIVVGDAKSFDLLRTIHSEYGAHLGWMLPFTGDWHILLNYQKALMKPYAEAGLTKLVTTEVKLSLH